MKNADSHLLMLEFGKRTLCRLSDNKDFESSNFNRYHPYCFLPYIWPSDHQGNCGYMGETIHLFLLGSWPTSVSVQMVTEVEMLCSSAGGGLG